MIKDMTPYTARKPGMNCFVIAVTNILLYKEYPYYQTIWKQCGLNYMKSKVEPLGSLMAIYMSIKEELELVHGIKVEQLTHDDPVIFVDVIRGLINNNEPVVVLVDTFELEYNIHYKSRHSRHCITVVDYDYESFTVIDDFYNYKGKLFLEDLIRASNFPSEAMYWLDHAYSIYHFCVDYSRFEINQVDFNNVLDLNNRILSGVLEDNSTVNIEKKIYYCNVAGIQGINKFISDLQLLIDNEKNINKELMDKLYKMLASISNSRYLYTDYLRSGSKNNHDLLELSGRYHYLGQGWNVAANMMIKGTFKNSKNMIIRMMNKLKDLKSYEMETLDLSKSLLSKHT